MSGQNDSRRWERVEAIFHQVWQVPQPERDRLARLLTAADPEVAREVQSLVRAAENSRDFLEDRTTVEASLISDVIRRWNPSLYEAAACGEPATAELLLSDQSSPSHEIDRRKKAPTVGEAVRGETIVSAEGTTLDTVRTVEQEELKSIQIRLAQQRPDLEVLEQIGRGGAGVVLRAFDKRLQRQVAVKVLHRHWTKRFGEDFLQREAQAAALVHDNVVRVYEVAPPGAEEGYLVMEWITGPSLRDYLATYTALRPSEAAILARHIALGLAAAHARGLLHRDIKPANVLLDPMQSMATSKPLEGRATPPNYRARLADFGLSHAAEPRDTQRDIKSDANANSHSSHFVGTPAYACPEMLLDGQSGTTSADIWSVGATLYQMLTGTPPYAGRLHAIMRQMRTQDPRPVRSIDHRIPRDLESICMKALARDPSQRYASATELAADLQRFSDGQAVIARPISMPVRWYRAARQHPLVSFLALLLVAALMVGTLISNTFRMRAEQNLAMAELHLEQATSQRDRARSVIQLLQGMISAADPNYGQRDVTMVAALSGLENRILDQLARQPDIEADLRSALGHIYFSLAEYERSRVQFETAVQLRAGFDDHALRLKDQTQLANTLRWLYEPDKALDLATKTAAESGRKLGASDAITIHASEVLAGCYKDASRLDLAEEVYRRVVAEAKSHLGEAHPLTLSSRGGLASVLISAGRYAEAEAELVDVLSSPLEASEFGNRDTLILRSNLAVALVEQGKLEALAQQTQISAAANELLGPNHDFTISSKLNLAESIRRSGDQQTALALQQQILNDCELEFGWSHPNTLGALEGVALTLVRLQQHAAALEVTERALEVLESELGEQDDWLHRVRSFKAAALSGLGDIERALPMYEQAVAHFEQQHGPLNVTTLSTKNNYGLALIQAGKGQEASELYGELLETIDQTFDSMRPILMRNQGHAKLSSGQHSEAHQLLTAAKELSSSRGELENVERCQELLQQLRIPFGAP